LIRDGQVFASPVLPFIREVKRFPDEPGARHLTWSRFAKPRKAKRPENGALDGLAVRNSVQRVALAARAFPAFFGISTGGGGFRICT